MSRFLYIFLDEGGNLDFSKNGTRFYTFTCISKERPFAAYKELVELKYDLAETGITLERFHATEDKRQVRDKVFDIIQKHLEGVRIDSLIVEKRKTGPALQQDIKFYSKMVGYLLQYTLQKHDLSVYSEVLVFTDSVPVSSKKKAMEKAIKETLSEMLPASARYKIFHHDSRSNLDLQIADYCNWAIYRKWDMADVNGYEKIKPAIKSEFDIFRTGEKFYY